MKSVSIIASGMVTGVGLTAPSSCAAIRCGINNFQETRFVDNSGEWITGSSVPLDSPWRGRKKLVKMVAPAIEECMNTLKNEDFKKIPLLLCVAEKNRPGRLDGLDECLLDEVQEELKICFHEKSATISHGQVGGVKAIEMAMDILYQSQLAYCIVAGTDSFLVAGTLAAFEKKDRLLTENNSDGFIPGEAGAAILLCKTIQNPSKQLEIKGIGFGYEAAFVDSGEPLRADGLVQAFKGAFSTSLLSMKDINYRIFDANGEQYKFKEGDLAVTRTLRDHKGTIDIWHPVDCVGEIGAAIVPCILSIADTAARKGYSYGDNVLCHFGNDNGDRAVMILIYSGNRGI